MEYCFFFVLGEWQARSHGSLSDEPGVRQHLRRDPSDRLLRASRLLHHHHGAAGTLQRPLRLHHGKRLPGRAAGQKLFQTGGRDGGGLPSEGRYSS